LQTIVQEHVCHPHLLWYDAAYELSRPDAWEKYSVSRITTEAMLLDMRNSVLAAQARPKDGMGTASATPGATPSLRSRALTTGRTRVSLEEMAAVSVALKSNLDVEIDSTMSSFPSALFPHPSGYDDGVSSPALSVFEDGSGTPKHVAQAVATLQRNVLLLRNELNFELWLSRENAQHIGRLFHERILSKNQETERQGLVCLNLLIL
jgi:hypothetical protein